MSFWGEARGYRQMPVPQLFWVQMAALMSCWLGGSAPQTWRQTGIIMPPFTHWIRHSSCMSHTGSLRQAEP